MSQPAPFDSFFIGGFECSTHRTRSGRRLDMVAATAHDRFADEDYRRLRSVGIRTAREGLRWHVIEESPLKYDFSSFIRVLGAARSQGIQVIWDLFHYGYPDDLDIFSAAFIKRFARFAREFASVYMGETDAELLMIPVNEISFLSWCGAEIGEISPFAVGRGYELKKQLVRAAIAAVDAVRTVVPSVRVCSAEPAFNVVTLDDRERSAAERYRQYQFQALDMLTGKLEPGLGGDGSYLDIVGVNYYPWNQWFYGGPVHAGPVISWTDPLYKPFCVMLSEMVGRYRRPIFVAETGSEGEMRADWFRHLCKEVRAGRAAGLPIEGVCLYPIIDFPGWEDDRDCRNGLWGNAGPDGERDACEDFLAELECQQKLLAEAATV